MRYFCIFYLLVSMSGCASDPVPESLPALEFAQALAKAQRYDEAIDRYLPILENNRLSDADQLEYLQVRRMQHEIETIGLWAMPKPLGRAPMTKWKHPPNFDQFSFELQQLAHNESVRIEIRIQAFTELLRAANNEEDYRWLPTNSALIDRCTQMSECALQWGRYEFIKGQRVSSAYQSSLEKQGSWCTQLYSAIANYNGDLQAFLFDFNNAISKAKRANVDPWVVRQLSAYRRYLVENYVLAQI